MFGQYPNRHPKDTAIPFPPFHLWKIGQICPATGATRTNALPNTTMISGRPPHNISSILHIQSANRVCIIFAHKKTGTNPFPISHTNVNTPHSMPPCINAFAVPGFWSFVSLIMSFFAINFPNKGANKILPSIYPITIKVR